MLGSRRHAGAAVLATIAFLVLVDAGAASGASVSSAPKKSCRLLKPAEISTAFGMEAGRGTQQGPDCTWRVGELSLSLETVTEDAKASYESLRDLAADAGAEPVKVKVPRGRAVFAVVASFKELLVLKGKTFLFLRLLDIEGTVDAATAQTAMTQLGTTAAKRV